MVYESMKQCATKTGTDYKLIKAAKGSNDAPGFNVGGSGSQRIDWDFGGNTTRIGLMYSADWHLFMAGTDKLITKHAFRSLLHVEA